MAISEHHAKAFWSKVDITTPGDCWLWLGAKKPTGYGNVRIESKYMLAHRVAWELGNFEPPPGYVVMHVCDTPSCCNPSHLMLGTAQANNCDKLIKGRGKGPINPALGEQNHNSKLTVADVISIRKQYGTKNQYELADEFGVSQPAIGSIIRRETWRHVE